MRSCTKCGGRYPDNSVYFSGSWCRDCKKHYDTNYRITKGINVGKWGRPPQEPIDRFLALVEELDNDCWRWLGALDKDGYGRFRLNDSQPMAHRAAYILLRGEIPEDKEACHTCDNTWCVNPWHIFLGSRQDNEDDKGIKGRRPAGEKHWNYKHGEYIDWQEKTYTNTENNGNIAANHGRWHVARGKSNSKCPLCKEG